MSLRTRFVSAVVSLTIAAGAIAGTAQPSAAGSLSKGEVAAIAGIGGFILGTAVGSAHRHNGHHGFHRISSWDLHVRRCYARYRTYNHRTDTYFGHDGYEHYCRL